MRRICVITVLVCFLVGCSNRDDTDVFQEIEASAMIDKVTNRESFLLFITNDACTACEEFQQDLEPVLEKRNVQAYVLDYADIDEDMADQVDLILTSFSSWPVLLYVEDGEVHERGLYEYSLDPEGWEEWLNNQNLIEQN